MADSFLVWRRETLGKEPATTTAELVRELATDRGVSERTVWRWFAKARQTGKLFPLLPGRCQECGGPLPQHATGGRRYCDTHATVAARVRRHRQRSRHG